MADRLIPRAFVDHGVEEAHMREHNREFRRAIEALEHTVPEQHNIHWGVGLGCQVFDSVKRMRSVAAAAGYALSTNDAALAWACASTQANVDWLPLPAADEELMYELMSWVYPESYLKQRDSRRRVG